MMEIEDIESDNIKKLSLIEPKWNENKKSFKTLISFLIKFDKITLLEFLINNFYSLGLSKFGFEGLEYYISYFAGMYGKSQLILDKIAINLDAFMIGVAKSGNFDLAKDLYFQYPYLINEFAIGAAKGNNTQMINYALQHGANNLDEIAYYVAKNKNFNELIYLISIGAINIKKIIIGAIKGGNISIITYLYKRGSIDIDYIATNAVKYNKLNVLVWAIENGATNYCSYLKIATERGHITIFRYLIENYSECQIYIQNFADIAIISGNLHILKYIANTNNIDVRKLLELSKKYKHKKIIDYIEKNLNTQLIGKKRYREYEQEIFRESKKLKQDNYDYME